MPAEEEIDVERLMADRPGHLSPEAAEQAREAREALVRMRQISDIVQAPLVARTPVGKALALGAKRLARKLMTTVLRQQSSYNRTNIRLTANLDERIRQLELEVERLRQRNESP